MPDTGKRVEGANYRVMGYTTSWVGANPTASTPLVSIKHKESDWDMVLAAKALKALDKRLRETNG